MPTDAKQWPRALKALFKGNANSVKKDNFFEKMIKTFVVLLGFMTWVGGCTEDGDISKSEARESSAVWVNMLAVDGCSWHFEILSKDSTNFVVPDQASLGKIESAVGKMEGAYTSIEVHLKYRLTGKKKDVACGWGHTANYEEISVIEISKK